MRDPLQIDCEQHDGTTVLRVTGELDHHTGPILVAALDGVGRPDTHAVRVVVDLTDCTFMDSAGSRAIALAARDRDRGSFGVVCPDEHRPVRMVLELVGLLELVDVRPTVVHFGVTPR